MKRSTIVLAFLLSTVLAVPAQAHGFGHGGYRGARDNHWIAPVLGVALVGSVIYAASTPSYAVPQTVVVQQPYVLPSRVAYFCPTAQQYYPNVASCAVPWQPVGY